jgi:hypothetical protein
MTLLARHAGPIIATLTIAGIFAATHNPLLTAAAALIAVAFAAYARARTPPPGAIAPVPNALHTLGRAVPLIALAGLLLAMLALWRHQATAAPVHVATTTTATPTPPTGFAETCVRLWLSHATGRLAATCNPDLDTTALTAGQPVTVDTVTALGAPQSVQDPNHPGYWSVLVAAELRDDAGARLETTYFRAVIHSTDNGLILYGLPRPAAAPVVTDTTTEPSTMPLSQPQADDPRAQVIREYLHRYLIAPPANNSAAGSVANQLVPSADEPPVVHSTAITDVTLQRVGFDTDPNDPGTESEPRFVAAVAEFRVVYVGGGDLVQQMTFQLERRGESQWLIADTPVVPSSLEDTP